MSTLQKAYFNGFTRVILLRNTTALGLTVLKKPIQLTKYKVDSRLWKFI